MKHAWLVAFLGYAAVVLVLFYPSFRTDSIISSGDISRSHYFYMMYLKESVWQGRLPLWNPYIFLGQPFLANPSIAFWYPLTWLFVFLPLPIAFALHMMVSVWLSMAGIYLFTALLLKQRGDPIPLAAWASGLVFGLGGYTMAHVYGGNYDVVAAGSWIGWVLFAFVETLLGNKRGPQLLAVTFGIQLLSGYLSMALYTITACGLLFCSYILVHRQSALKTTLRLLAGGLLGLGIGAIQLLPGIEFTQRTIRTIPVGYPWHSIGAIHPGLLLTLLTTYPNRWILWYHEDGVMYWEHAMYIGGVAFVFACVGVASLWYRKQKRISLDVLRLGVLLVLVFAAWAAVGRLAPKDLYYYLWRYVPLYGLLRIPGRFVYLISAMAAVLSGLGIAFESRIVPARYRTAAQAVIVAVLLGELFLFAKRFIVMTAIPDAYVDQRTRATLQETLKAGERFSTENNYEFGYDAPVGYRLPSINGYDVTMLRDPYLMELAALGYDPVRLNNNENAAIPYNHPLLEFLAVRVAIGGSLAIPDGTKQERLGRSESRWAGDQTVYKNERIFPRWYLMPEGKSYKSDIDLFFAIRRGVHPYQHTVGFIGTVPPLDGTPCRAIEFNAVAITTEEPETIRLSIHSPCSGYLTGSQVYFPGWTATIDGKPAVIYRGNLGFMALPISKGTHTVELTYHSTYLVWGALITLMSVCILGYTLKRQTAR